MDELLDLRAEAIWGQIKDILEELAAKENLELHDWYHDEPRWFLHWKSLRGAVDVETCYKPEGVSGVLLLTSRVYEGGQWQTLCAPEKIPLKVEGALWGTKIKVPKSRFKNALKRVVKETFAQAPRK